MCNTCNVQHVQCATCAMCNMCYVQHVQCATRAMWNTCYVQQLQFATTAICNLNNTPISTMEVKRAHLVSRAVPHRKGERGWVSCHSSGSMEGSCPSLAEVINDTDDLIQCQGLLKSVFCRDLQHIHFATCAICNTCTLQHADCKGELL